MTMPDDTRASKPRRLGLWLPFVVVGVAFAVWSGVWLMLRGQIASRIDETAADLRRSGYDVAWKDRRISGYPFRFEVELDDAKAAEPSGWGLAAPRLKAVAAAYRIDHWVFVASDGATLWRPDAGPVDISAQVLRASIADASKGARFSLEGLKLGFQSREGAKPFPFTAADKLEVHLRPQGGDQTALMWLLEGAQTRRTGVFAQIAPLAPLSLRMAATLDKRSDLAGPQWTQSVRRWTAAGGSIQVSQLQAAVGDVSVTARGGPLTVGDDGRLRGNLGLEFQRGAAAFAALGAMQGIDGAQLQLSFREGDSTIGPVRIGPAPRVY